MVVQELSLYNVLERESLEPRNEGASMILMSLEHAPANKEVVEEDKLIEVIRNGLKCCCEASNLRFVTKYCVGPFLLHRSIINMLLLLCSFVKVDQKFAKLVLCR